MNLHTNLDLTTSVSPPPQSPIWHVFLLLLDFCRILRHLKVQSLRLTGGGKIVFLNSKNEGEVQDWYEQIKKIHTDIETDE